MRATEYSFARDALDNGAVYTMYATMVLNDSPNSANRTQLCLTPSEFTVSSNNVISSGSDKGFPLGNVMSRALTFELINGRYYNDSGVEQPRPFSTYGGLRAYFITNQKALDPDISMTNSVNSSKNDFDVVDYYGAEFNVRLVLKQNGATVANAHIQEGNFHVYQDADYGDVVVIHSMDSLYKTDVTFYPSDDYEGAGVYLWVWFRDACQCANLTPNPDTLTMLQATKKSWIYNAEKPMTCREFLGYIAMMVGGNVVYKYSEARSQWEVTIQKYDFSASAEMGTTESVPYSFRKTGGSAKTGTEARDTIVGGTVVWNQIVPNGTNGTSSAVVRTRLADGWWHLEGTASSEANMACYSSFATVTGHVYAFKMTYRNVASGTAVPQLFNSVNSNSATNYAKGNAKYRLLKATRDYSSTTARPRVYLDLSYNLDLIIIGFDVTKTFGPTIADYVNTLETATQGAGWAWLEEMFPEAFYTYTATPTLESVKTRTKKTVEYNQWDEQWEVGGYNTSGVKVEDSTRIRSKNYIPIFPNTAYRSTVGGYFMQYDANKIFLSRNEFYSNTTFTTDAGSRYMTFHTYSSYGTSYKNDITIGFSVPEMLGAYRPYVEHSYHLDGSVELRGVPKLDANNRLYYDGDIYYSNGTISRRYAVEVFTGQEAWTKSSAYAGSFWRATENHATAYSHGNAVCSHAQFVTLTSTTYVKGSFSYDGTNKVNINIWLPQFDANTTVDQFKTYLQEQYAAGTPLTFVYEASTVTTEQALPFASVQTIDPLGTEEYVDAGDRGVSIPIGHQTVYVGGETDTENYRLNESNGYYSSNNDYVIKSYSVTAGEHVSVVSDDRFQFQSNNVVSTSTSSRVGSTYGAGEFNLTVPSGATSLMISTLKTGSTAKVDYDYGDGSFVIQDWFNCDKSLVDVMITGVKTTVDKQEISFGNDGYMLSLTNPLIHDVDNERFDVDIDDDTLQNLMDIYKVVGGRKFRIFNGEIRNFPFAEYMDAIKFYDYTGEEYTSILTSIDHTVNGMTRLANTADSPTRVGLNLSSDTVKIEQLQDDLIQERTERQKIEKDFQDALLNSYGLHSTIDVDENGGSIWYLHDRTELSESVTVFKMNASGFGISNDGGQTYQYGVSSNGNLIMDIISSNYILGDWIKAGKLTVSDGNGNVVFEVDTGKEVINGEIVPTGTGPSVTMNASSVTISATNNTLENYVAEMDSFVEGIENDGVTKVKTEKGYKFDDEGLKITGETNDIQNILDEQGMRVMGKNDTTGEYTETLLDVTYDGVVMDKLDVNNVDVGDSISIGKWQFQMMPSVNASHMGCFFVG